MIKKSVKGRIIIGCLVDHSINVKLEAEYKFYNEHLVLIEAMEV